MAFEEPQDHFIIHMAPTHCDNNTSNCVLWIQHQNHIWNSCVLTDAHFCVTEHLHLFALCPTHSLEQQQGRECFFCYSEAFPAPTCKTALTQEKVVAQKNKLHRTKIHSTKDFYSSSFNPKLLRRDRWAAHLLSTSLVNDVHYLPSKDIAEVNDTITAKRLTHQGAREYMHNTKEVPWGENTGGKRNVMVVVIPVWAASSGL